jgi:hypothetical protein
LSINGFCFGFVHRTLKELVGEASLEIFAAPKQGIEELLKALASNEEFSHCAIKPIAKTVYNALIGGTDIFLVSERIDTWPFYPDAAVTEDTKLNRDLKELEITILMQANRTLFSMNSIACSDIMLGKCWNSVTIDDLVCVIMGCDVPLILRPVENHFVLIGDCYVEGIMEGEAMDFVKNGKVEMREFCLY